MEGEKEDEGEKDIGGGEKDEREVMFSLCLLSLTAANTSGYGKRYKEREELDGVREGDLRF
jgi:hypothetical protein